MKMKLRLDVEKLEVEAFATSASGTAKSGTVRGHNGGSYPTDWGCGGTDGCTQAGDTCSGPYPCFC